MPILHQRFPQYGKFSAYCVIGRKERRLIATIRFGKPSAQLLNNLNTSV